MQLACQPTQPSRHQGAQRLKIAPPQSRSLKTTRKTNRANFTPCFMWSLWRLVQKSWSFTSWEIVSFFFLVRTCPTDPECQALCTTLYGLNPTAGKDIFIYATCLFLSACGGINSHNQSLLISDPIHRKHPAETSCQPSPQGYQYHKVRKIFGSGINPPPITALNEHVHDQPISCRLPGCVGCW